MGIDTKTNKFLCLLAWILPLAVVLPYLFFVHDLKALIWVWQNRYVPFWLILALSIGTALLCNYLFLRANRFAIYFFQAVALIVLAQASILAMQERRHLVLIVIFLESAALLMASEWMRYVLNLPYYSGRRSWWESYPKALPKIKAVLIRKNNETVPVRITNLSQDGCFVFLNQKPTKKNINDTKSIQIDFGHGRVLEAPAVRAFLTLDRLGFGFRFTSSSLPGDWHKEFADYINELKRGGYAI